MTGFDILLVCLICWIISFIITYKHLDRPTDFMEWFLLSILSLLILIVVGLCLILMGMLFYGIYLGIVQTDWHNFFTHKII
jgi:uncharacterized membrane protein YhdT